MILKQSNQKTVTVFMLLTTTFHCKTFQLPEMAFNNFLFRAILFQHDTIRRFFYNLTTGHHCPPLASDQQRRSQPFLFDFDVLIFLKFRELFSWFLISEKWDGSSVFGEREDAVVS